MTPLFYTVTNDRYEEKTFGSIDEAVSHLKSTDCPAHIARDRSPVRTHLFGGETQSTDLSPYLEDCGIPLDKANSIAESLDKVIDDHERRWAKIQAALKPGEIYRPYSGEKWFFRKDRAKYLNEEYRKWQVKWRD